MVQELAAKPEGQRGRADAEEADSMHHASRAQGVQPPESSSGEDELRGESVRSQSQQREVTTAIVLGSCVRVDFRLSLRDLASPHEMFGRIT